MAFIIAWQVVQLPRWYIFFIVIFLIKKNENSNVFIIALFDRLLVLPNKLVNFWDELVLLNTGEEGLKVRELQKRVRKPNSIIRELYRPYMKERTQNKIQSFAQISLDDNEIWLKIK